MKMNISRGSVLVSAVLLIWVDQITKRFAVILLRDTGVQSTTVIPGLLEFRYLENDAAALGLFENMIWLVMLLAMVVAAGILAALFLYKEHTAFSYTASALLLAGGVGNLIDRMVNSGRFVIDFIHVMFFPYIFNFADCCVTVGAVFLVLHYIVCIRRSREDAPEGRT